MFEFLMSADLGINPIDIGAAAPTFSSAFSTPLPPMTEPLSEETIARFQAAMEKPLADNAILQQALESMVVTKGRPVVITEKPAVQVPILHTENTEVTKSTIVVKPIIVEKPVNVEKSVVADKSQQVVVTEAPKASEPPMNFVAKEQPAVVSVDKPVVSDRPQDKVLATENTKVTEAAVVVKPVENEKKPEEVTIAALPQGVAPEAIVRPIEVKPIEVAPVVSASVEAKVEAVTAAEVLVQAANAVADTMLVSPGLMRGEGEIIVHLKPEVLEATELKISVQSGTMTVEFAPTVEKIATLLTQNQANLVQVLSERVGRYNVVVNVRPSHLKGSRNARA